MGKLYNNIEKYSKVESYRFHTPGHSGCIDFPNMIKFDITELSFSDNLQLPSDSILNIEKRLEVLYGVEKVCVLTAGATIGIQISMLIARDRGGRIAIVGEAHKSVYSAIEIFGLKIAPFNKDFMDLDAVLITSPNYIGQVLKDRDEIIKAARKNNILTIVDESHGAHFIYSTLFPKTAIGLADLVISSYHKTLPVLTGGAGINAINEELGYECIKYRQKIHTTSPSYLTLSSIDKMLDDDLETKQDIYRKIKIEIDRLKSIKFKGFKFSYLDDFTRILIKLEYQNINNFIKKLESTGIYIEGVIDEYLVLIITPYNYKSLEIVLNRIERIINSDYALFNYEKINEDNCELVYNNSKLVSFDDAEGMTSIIDVGIYPPGIVIIKSDSIIGREQIEKIKKSNNLFGVINNKILVKVNNEG